ncbi:MAG: choice-of-anchor tandem repeat GloVer-containing protein [Tepidisphaeraceae bacterium]|jgi:uncharacterized repeat protein (TIGR03803 family)
MARADGDSPYSGLILSGNTLYGTTYLAGPYAAGAVFSLPITGLPIGGTPTVLANFNVTNGSNPFGGLIRSGNTLYGTTTSGGTYGDGTVFSLPITGGTPTVLASFDGADGSGPFCSLILSGSTLYGTTLLGGNLTLSNYFGTGDGTVFSLPITGGTPTVLVSFDGTDGSLPYCTLVDLNNILYGTTEAGGANNEGTVFELPVPEPAIGSLLLIGSAAMCVRRRRKQLV